MAEPLDVLGFADGIRESGGPSRTLHSRELAINGRQLAELVTSSYEAYGSPASPVARELPAVAIAYLEGLCGQGDDAGLRAGRVTIGVCPLCFDSSCGVLLAATLDVAEDTIAWRDLGHEIENFAVRAAPAPKGTRRAIWQDPEEWWTPDPLRPEVGFRFDRNQYESAIADEIARARETL